MFELNPSTNPLYLIRVYDPLNAENYPHTIVYIWAKSVYDVRQSNSVNIASEINNQHVQHFYFNERVYVLNPY